MKGISLMLITACMLTGSMYAMDIVPENMQVERMPTYTAEIVTSVDYQPQVATLVTNPSFDTDLNSASEGSVSGALQNLANAIEAVKKQQQEEEEAQGTVEEQNPMTASVMLNLEIDKSLEETRIEKEQAVVKTKATIELIRKAIGQNADSRGELIKQQSELQINTEAMQQEIKAKLKGLPQILNKDSNAIDISKPITKSIKELAVNLVLLDKIKHTIVEKTNTDATLRTQLDELQQSLTPEQQREVQQKASSGRWYTLWLV